MNDVVKHVFKKDFEDAVNSDRQRVAADMLKENLSISLIEKISKLSEDTIRGIASSLNIAVT